MAEKVKSSADGSLSALPISPADSADCCCAGGRLPANRGELRPETMDLFRAPEYVRTTTGWLERVVRLEVDFAAWLRESGDARDWKAGALRARRAADCVDGIVLVRVVVALGTEPMLAVRSMGRFASSNVAGALAMSVDEASKGNVVGTMSDPHDGDRKPNATACLVVVAGVKAGGSVALTALASSAPWLGTSGAEAEVKSASMAGRGRIM